MDNDQVKVSGQTARSFGQVIHVSECVPDARGEPKLGSAIEIWQCSASGIHRYPRTAGQGRVDNAFQDYGRLQVDQQGQYRFCTIWPVLYSGWTPHIHFAIHVPG
jgi:protocatechuate 3,4-dioxygenase beta subunit